MRIIASCECSAIPSGYIQGQRTIAGMEMGKRKIVRKNVDAHGSVKIRVIGVPGSNQIIKQRTIDRIYRIDFIVKYPVNPVHPVRKKCYANSTVSPKENENIDSPLFYKQRLR